MCLILDCTVKKAVLLSALYVNTVLHSSGLMVESSRAEVLGSIPDHLILKIVGVFMILTIVDLNK